jgi:hypothetical protein
MINNAPNAIYNHLQRFQEHLQSITITFTMINNAPNAIYND